ncbi:P-loop ATPase, Sll1717 family [Desulforegula conservatrix]|uniref:P-loop ATPase, Sll1717 family n=1 Tax=Desulforegula conservatrix TaxID=153026 RepID=UPI0004030E69|nr:hypothetical protein [Desulforegula conservatrix]
MPPSNMPFGDPDGSRADLANSMNKFVTFQDESVWGGIAMESNDFSARVIAGRKGSGKTIYLRRLRASSHEENSIYGESYLDDIQQNIPNTELIVKFCQWFKPVDLTEKWRELWRRAILRSLFTHIVHKKQLSVFVSDNEKKKLNETYKEILPFAPTPLSIYSQVIDIIHQHRSGRHFTIFCNSPLWESLEYDLGEILKTMPPVCFFVDAVDDEFAHAPMYWLRCQKGLFYQVMRFLRDSRLGSRLHIFICIRDLVLASVFRSEHQTRYRDQPHIRILKWDKESIKLLLRAKVFTLEKHFYYDQSSSGNSVSDWLGTDFIENGKRNIFEPIESYILRHTRLLPRDIIIIGNRICSEIKKNHEFNMNLSPAAIIKKAVHECTKIFAAEQIAICGNHLSSDMMPEHAAAHEYSGIYTSEKEYVEDISHKLIKLLKELESDMFFENDIRRLSTLSTRLFGDTWKPFNVLWQHGLIGYIDEMDLEPKFYSETHLDHFLLPKSNRGYIMHSCLCDYLGPQKLCSLLLF